jgi:iron complex outermembrane receptor protein/hemoglobin/transferrin/lactoferrin receptor protein
MRRILLLAAASAPLWLEGASAQTADDEITIEPVIVTGTAREASVLTTPADVSRLAGEEKARLQSSGLGNVLDGFAGVDTIGTGDQVGKPVIRGLSGNRVRILSDELALDFQQYGVRHPANIDPYIAEEIEIVRGAAGILYGSDAIGGVVNVISERPPSTDRDETLFAGKATLGYQSAYRQTTGALQLEAANGPLGAVGTLVLRNSDGLVVPDEPTALETGDTRGPLVTGDVPFTDFEQVNGDIAIGYQTPRGPVTLRWEGYRSDQNFVVPDPPPPDFDAPLQPGGIGQDLENDIIHLFAELDMGETLQLVPSLAYSRNLRVANPGPPEPLPRSELPDAAVIDILRENVTARVDLKHGPQLAGLTGRIGAEAVLIDQESRGAVALTPGGDITKLAVFALEEASFGDLIVNAGARIDRIEIEADPGKTNQEDFLEPVAADALDQDYTVATGSIGAVYRVSENLSITGNLARGFRAPTIFELFVDGVHGGVAAVQKGDPDLGEETSLNADASLRYEAAGARAKLTGYVNDISDFIFLAGTGDTNPGGLPIFQVSQQDAQLAGFDIEGGVNLSEWSELRGTLEYVDGELDDGRQVPLLPPLKLGGELEFTRDRLGPAREGYIVLGVSYADSQQSAGLIEPFGQFDAPPPPFGTGSTDSYTLVDLQAGLSFDTVDLSLNVENLLDEPYRDFLDTYKNITLGPGRNVMLTLSTEF